jgi:hypothetical protein
MGRRWSNVMHHMGRRWSNVMAKDAIGRRSLLILWSCMLVVMERRMYYLLKFAIAFN